MSILIHVKSDARLETGTIAKIHVPKPDEYIGKRLVVRSVEPFTGASRFELLEMQVGSELAWWTDYEETLKPIERRRGQPFVGNVAVNNPVTWLYSDIAITVRCIRGPAVFVARIVTQEEHRQFSYPTRGQIASIRLPADILVGQQFPTARVSKHTAKEWSGRRGQRGRR